MLSSPPPPSVGATGAMPPAIPPGLAGSTSPLLLSLAYTKFDSASAYGRGPRSLVYSQRKRLVLGLAALLALTSAIVLSTLCLYTGFCIAEDVGTRTTYSQGASEAVLPVCLILIFVLAPLSALSGHLQRPGLTAIALGCHALSFVLLVAATIGSFVVMGQASTRAATLWSTLPSIMRQYAYSNDVSNLATAIQNDARGVALSALAGAVLTGALAFLHGKELQRMILSWRSAFAAVSAARAQSQSVAGGATLPLPSNNLTSAQVALLSSYGWWKQVPDAFEDDVSYGQLLSRPNWVRCCATRPTAAVRIERCDCFGLCNRPAIESCSALFPCCCRPPPPPVPMPYPQSHPATLALPSVPAVPPPSQMVGAATTAAAVPTMAQAGGILEAATGQQADAASFLSPQSQQADAVEQAPAGAAAEPQPSPQAAEGLPDPQAALSPQTAATPSEQQQQQQQGLPSLVPPPQQNNDLMSMLTAQAQPAPQF